MIEKYVVFNVKRGSFALPSQVVKEIVYSPGLVPIPKAPSFIRGLGNLRGSVIPIIDLGVFLWGERIEVSDDTKMVVVDSGKGHIGFLVDKVSFIRDFDTDRIEGVDSVKMDFLECAKAALKGVIESEGEMIFIINHEEVINVPSSEEKGVEGRKIEKMEGSEGEKVKKEEEEVVVVFSCSGEEFCVDISTVEEIIDYPESLKEVPQAPDYVIGIFPLRGRVIPLLSIARILELSGEEKPERVVVLNIHGRRVGISADRAKEVMRIKKDVIDPPPETFSDDEKDCFKGTIKLNGGKRLILYLNPERVIPHLESITGEGEETMEERIEESGGKVAMYLWFEVSGQLMAFPLDQVREVVNLEEVIPVPKAPSFVEGVMNLRGEVLPVISLAKRLELSEEERELRRVIVSSLEDKGKVGFIVDSVKGILKVSEDQIFPPENIPSLHERFILGVTRVEDKGLIIILNIRELLTEEEQESLRSIGEEGIVS